MPLAMDMTGNLIKNDTGLIFMECCCECNGAICDESYLGNYCIDGYHDLFFPPCDLCRDSASPAWEGEWAYSGGCVWSSATAPRSISGGKSFVLAQIIFDVDHYRMELKCRTPEDTFISTWTGRKCSGTTAGGLYTFTDEIGVNCISSPDSLTLVECP